MFEFLYRTHCKDFKLKIKTRNCPILNYQRSFTINASESILENIAYALGLFSTKVLTIFNQIPQYLKCSKIITATLKCGTSAGFLIVFNICLRTCFDYDRNSSSNSAISRSSLESIRTYSYFGLRKMIQCQRVTFAMNL